MGVEKETKDKVQDRVYSNKKSSVEARNGEQAKLDDQAHRYLGNSYLQSVSEGDLRPVVPAEEMNIADENYTCTVSDIMLTGEPGAVDFYPLGVGKWYLRAGKKSAEEAGVIYIAFANLNPKDCGEFEFIQNVRPDRTCTFRDGGVLKWSADWGLDSRDPYPSQSLDQPGNQNMKWADDNSIKSRITNDSPGLLINCRIDFIESLVVNDKFELFLMLRPKSGSASQRTTIAKANWSWYAKLSRKSKSESGLDLALPNLELDASSKVLPGKGIKTDEKPKLSPVLKAAEIPWTPAKMSLQASLVKDLKCLEGQSHLKGTKSTPKKREYGKEFEEYARLLREAMAGWGTEEEQIYEVLQQVYGNQTAIDSLKRAYMKEYRTALVDDLRDEMSGSELDFALALLGEKPLSKSAEIRSRTFNEQDYTDAVKRLSEAMEGPGTDEELIFAALLPFAGSFERISMLKTSYYARTESILEEDVGSELSGDELEYAMKLLHSPLKPAKGMAEGLLAEAEREVAPGTACTTASMKRYVRAYLDYYYLNGQLAATERQRAKAPNSKKYLDARDKLKKDLINLLGSLGKRYLDGGPNIDIGPNISRTLKNPNVIGASKAKRFYEHWQMYGVGTAEGATRALSEEGLGTRLTKPGTEDRNIEPLLWNEILKPGYIIQTWSTQGSANALGCVAGAPALGGDCGHSFIFVEYVYARTPLPPKDNARTWRLYGGSGTPINTGGEVDSARDPLSQLRRLYLVGMRIIDQKGYHFVPKNTAYINAQVLPGQLDRVNWIANSKVWYAASLVY